MSILEEILEIKKEEVKKIRKEFSIKRFEDSEFFTQKKINFLNALSSKNKISLIAEIKKASPSKGIIQDNFNHIKTAEIYFKNEVDAVSILTDVNFFKGSIQFLNDIAKFKEAPLLRKDFIIDEYQVFEAKANGADAILLIAEALTKSQINELTYAAIETGLDVLLELHSEQEISKIDFRLNKIIGINNRDLKSFFVSLDTTFNISQKLPEDILIVSESGITNKDDIYKLKDTRTDAVLVGEHFMNSQSPGDEIKRFKEWCIRES